ncbi:MAG TPA: biotin carboxylase N-terminal domain-containing protein [Ktedonobacterales bacterium]
MTRRRDLTPQPPLPQERGSRNAAHPDSPSHVREGPGLGSALIRRVLVANRGEIARRVIRSCHAMGIATIAVYSDADASAAHVCEADAAYHLGPSPAAESYLNVPALLEAARAMGADALHPGYGFLSENVRFAQACRDAGLTFVGPQPETIALMGSKREAKILMAAAGVPVVPGYEGEDQSDERLIAAAREIGWPVMVKASAGGGGKGMRVVERADDLPAALASARREALSAFGDDTLILEKVIPEPRHVEFQIFGDMRGNVIHLGERECTIQRRHQKIVEETPSTALTAELRAAMGRAAVLAGQRIGYIGAGTVEFIVAPNGDFYFLEVNTRLQVEHPVTELVTGLDLVRWQILVAEGRPLPLTQDEITFYGHAVEARVYAEDPAHGFLPATGHVALWRASKGEGVRVDAGIQTGDEVTPYYDPMLAKVCAWGETREEALRRLDRALGQTVLFGVRNNVDYLRRVLLHPAHVAGRISTAFVERYAEDLLPGVDLSDFDIERLAWAGIAVALRRLANQGGGRNWRNNPWRPVIERFDCGSFAVAGDGTGALPIEIRLSPRRDGSYNAEATVASHVLAMRAIVRGERKDELDLELDRRRVTALVVHAGGDQWWAGVGETTVGLVWRDPLPQPSALAHHGGSLTAPMPGQVIAVQVAEGQRVRRGDALFILEAMKMEHTVRAPADGVVTRVRFAVGDQTPAGALLAEMVPIESESVS